MYNLSSHPAPWVQFVHPSRVNEVVWIDSFELSSLRVNVRPKIEAFKPELAFILPQQEGGTVRSLITKMVFLRSLGVRCAVLGWRSGTGPLFRKRRYEAGRIEHAVSAPLKAVHEHRKLGKLDLNTVSFNLDIPEEDLKWADQLLRQQGCLEFKMVAVSLSSVQPHKQWGIEHFIALCQKLRQEEGVYVLLVGTKETREPGDEIVRLLGTRGLNLCGQTTITKLAAILRHCSLVVGNDGGTMHVAAAVGRKSVSIMPGIEYPGSIEPWGNAENAIREKVDCSPCYSFMRCPLGHMNCMTSINVVSVLTRCRLLLRSISTPPDQACLKTK